jgi:acetolactate synthase regulatory subunit
MKKKEKVQIISSGPKISLDIIVEGTRSIRRILNTLSKEREQKTEIISIENGTKSKRNQA